MGLSGVLAFAGRGTMVGRPFEGQLSWDKAQAPSTAASEKAGKQTTTVMVSRKGSVRCHRTVLSFRLRR
jgi:hypothetical protein